MALASLPTTLASRAAASFGAMRRTLGLIWSAAPGWTAGSLAIVAAQGALPVATVYLSRPLVDALAAQIASGAPWAAMGHTLWLAGSIGVLLLLNELLNNAGEWVRATQAELVHDHIRAMVHEQSTAVDLAFYESADFYDQLHRARDEAASRPLELLENVGALIQNGVTLLGMATMLLAYGAWLPLALAASALPTLLVVLRHSRQYHAWWARTTPDRRWAEYYDSMLTEGEPAAEMRLFELGPPFRAAYRQLRQRLMRERLRLVRGQALTQAATSAGALAIGGAALVWMLGRAARGQATLGDLVLFYQVFDRGQSLVRTLLSSVGQMYANSLFLSSLFAFLDLRPRVASPPNSARASVRRAIEFRTIRFCYPGSERVALDGFNLTVRAGQVAAIVGANGAGKSTLVKLLCRFYDPDAGTIEFDGVDIRALAIDELRQLVTVLFQAPLEYHATAGENIAMSVRAAAPSAAAIEAAARAAGAHETIARLPEGYDTLLGKWFADGTGLSGGEWQRVALARAFLRQAPLVVLDEPTSAMDSWAEAEWLDRLRELIADSTAIIITHRFTTAMRADVIHVMDAGRIVESGAHDELLARGGRYAQSWAAQMRDHADAPAL